MRETHHHVQIADDPFRLTMAEKKLSVRSLDSHAFVAPHVGTAIPNAADSITTQPTPWLNPVFLDLCSGNRTQTKSKAADLQSMTSEAVTESIPDDGRNSEHHQADEGSAETHFGPRGDRHHPELKH